MENNLKDMINGKIEEAIAILMALASTFKFDFTLNHTSPIEGVKSGIAYNEGMNIGILDHFISNLLSLKNDVNMIPNMLDEGYFIVICINDLNKPVNFKGDWVVKNNMYIVQEIRATSRGKYCYILKDLNPLKPYDGYTCDRFVRIVANCDHN